MKKVTFLLAALIIGGMMLTGCSKPDTKGYYSYSTSFHFQLGDDVSALDEIVKPKLAQSMYTLTKEEAVAEWNSFLQSVQNVNVSFANPDSYYTVKFNRIEEKDGSFAPVENIGEKTWK